MLGCALFFGLISGVAYSQSDRTKTQVNINIYGDWKVFNEADGLASRSVQSLAVHGSHLWVGTDHGLTRYDGTTWKTWTAKDGLPDDAISSIAIDPETKDVWLGSWDHGLIRLTGGRFDFFDQFNSGLAGNFVYSLTIDRGKVYAPNIGGVSVYDPLADAWELFSPRQSDGSHSIFTSITPASGKLYASTLSGSVKEIPLDDDQLNGMDVFQNTEIHPSAKRAIGLEKSVGVVSGDQGKTLWLATQRGVFRKQQQGSWESQTFPFVMAQDLYVQCVAVSDDNTLWLGTDNGLFVMADWKSNTWVHYRYDPVELQGEVIVLDSTGIIKTLNPFFSIPYNNIRTIVFDEEAAWIGTAEGLVRASKLAPIDIMATRPPKPVLQDAPLQVEKKNQSYDKNKTPGLNTRPALAVYGPRNRTIALPGKKINTRINPDRADSKSVHRCLMQFNKQLTSKDHRVELFEMSPGYERYGWGLPEDDIVYFARRANIAGVVGLLDQRHREAAEVIARVEIPFINVAPEEEFNRTGSLHNPWLFRCWGDQPRQHRMLLDYVVRDLGLSRVAIVSVPGLESQTHLNWWKNHALKKKYDIVADVHYSPTGSDHADFVAELTRSNPQVILTWADRENSANLLRQIREAGLDALVVTSHEPVVDDFTDQMGVAAGEVLALMPVSFGTDEKHVSSLTRAGFRESSSGSDKSDSHLLHETRSYEATDHMFYAIKMAGKDRRMLKQVLQMMNFSALGELHYERRHQPLLVTFSLLTHGQWISQTLPPN